MAQPRPPGAPGISARPFKRVAASKLVAEDSSREATGKPRSRRGPKKSGGKGFLQQEPADLTRSPPPTKAQGKASYGGDKGQGTLLGSDNGQDLGGQSAIDSERCRWQRTVDALGADDKPKNARKNHIYHQYQLRSIQRQERQEFSGDQPSEGLGPRGEQGLQGRGSFKSERYQEEELPVSIRVKVRGKPSSSKEKQEAAAGRSPEVPVPAPDSEQKPRGAETFKRQTVQGQDPPVHISRTMAIQTEGAQEANEQIQEQDSQDGGQGDTYVKRITAIGNRHWPGLAGRKPRHPEDPALRT